MYGSSSMTRIIGLSDMDTLRARVCGRFDRGRYEHGVKRQTLVDPDWWERGWVEWLGGQVALGRADARRVFVGTGQGERERRVGGLLESGLVVEAPGAIASLRLAQP